MTGEKQATRSLSFFSNYSAIPYELRLLLSATASRMPENFMRLVWLGE